MTDNVLTATPTATRSVVLGIHRGDKCLYQFELLDGKSVIAGSDKNCGIRLDGGMVAPIHALFHLINGTLLVRNWGSQSRTLVNGEAIDGQAEIDEDSQVCLGEYVIMPMAAAEPARSRELNPRNPFEPREQMREVAAVGASAPSGSATTHAPGPAGSSAIPAADRQSGRADPVDASTPPASDRTAPTTEPGTTGRRPASPSSAAADRAEAGDWGGREDRTQGVDRPAIPEPLDVSGPTAPSAFDEDPGPAAMADHPDDQSVWAALTQTAGDDVFGQETIELLRLEVEQLQREVAERDARLAALASEGPTSGGQPTASQEETERLVERLEQLLDELTAKDERITALEEMLSAAEEVRAAELEERRQLENWLREIEQRMTERDGEREVEAERLRQRAREAAAARARLEQQLRSYQSDGPAPQDRLADELVEARQEIAELKQQLDEAQEAGRRLRQQLDEQARPAQTDDGSSPVSNESLRAELLQLAQERAELARQREELARQRSQLAQQRESADNQGGRRGHEVDDRIQAFREHLREVHQLEQKEAAERSLGARLARLWNRLDR